MTLLTRPFRGNTELLFLTLLRMHRCSVVCDVGSHDGGHARKFRAVLPNARVLAFEPDPRNLATMAADPGLIEAGVEVHGVAVGSRDGPVELHLLEGEEDDGLAWGMLSSTRERTSEGTPPVSHRSSRHVVSMVRLDSVLDEAEGSVALWIDTEGGAFEVVDGAARTLVRTTLVHVEVEVRALWSGQRTERDVRLALEAHGFTLVGQGRSLLQRDLVFVRRAGAPALWASSLLVVLGARVITPAWRVIRRLLPRGRRGRRSCCRMSGGDPTG